jgi:hypothetical protein
MTNAFELIWPIQTNRVVTASACESSGHRDVACCFVSTMLAGSACSYELGFLYHQHLLNILEAYGVTQDASILIGLYLHRISYIIHGGG